MFNLVPMTRGFMSMPSVFNEVDSLFENFFKDPFFKKPFFPEYVLSENTMKMDIRENEKEYILEADLPGLKKEDLRLDFNNDRLTISVERDEELQEEKDSYLRKERRIQSLSRVIPFSGVNEEGIKAKYENGVLVVNLPKKNVTTAGKHQIHIE